MDLIKVCFLILSICFIQSIYSLPLEHFSFSDNTTVVVHACQKIVANDSTPDVFTSFDSICLFTCIKSNCENYKLFSIQPKDIKNIAHIASTKANDKLLIGMVSNKTESIHIFKCGHASCTSYRSSYKPIIDTSKDSIGFGISIASRSDNKPIVSYFSKKGDVTTLNYVDCEDEYCDKYKVVDVSTVQIVNEEVLSSKIFFGLNDTPIVVINNGRNIISYRKFENCFVETVLVTGGQITDISFDIDVNGFLFSFISDNHAHVGRCDLQFSECETFTPPFLPGERGSTSIANAHSKETVIYSTVFASTWKYSDSIEASLQYAFCNDTACTVNHTLYIQPIESDVKMNVLNTKANQSTSPFIHFQYENVTSPLYFLKCEVDDYCRIFNLTETDPQMISSSKFQKRINIAWAIVILPALCIATAIVLAVWRINRYFKDKKETYQPII